MKKIVACQHSTLDGQESKKGVADLVVEFQKEHPSAEIEVGHSAYTTGPWHYVSVLLIAREESRPAWPTGRHLVGSTRIRRCRMAPIPRRKERRRCLSASLVAA